MINGLNFKFTLVKGDKGDTGATGRTGRAGNGISNVYISPDDKITFTFTNGTTFTTPSLKGETGTGLEILDIYPTLADLQTAHPTGSAGDLYLVGVSPSYELYLWSTENTDWEAGGQLTSPSPSATVPLMDGVASTGSELAYARGDHTHPSDSTKASLQQVYPIGSIYMNVNNTNPATLFGFGTWVQLKDRFLLGAGDDYTGGATGGEAEHTLTIAEMPSHNHITHFRLKYVSGSGNIQSAPNDSYWRDIQDQPSENTGGGGAHNNMPPYLVVYIWKRTA